jgi:hypothetical protein
MQRYRQSPYNRSIQRMAVMACGGLLLAFAGPASERCGQAQRRQYLREKIWKTNNFEQP